MGCGGQLRRRLPRTINDVCGHIKEAFGDILRHLQAEAEKAVRLTERMLEAAYSCSYKYT